MYFIIYISEDGDLSIDKLDKAILLERINEGYWGSIKFNDSFPGKDPNHWDKPALIIKGNIVVPKPVTLVEKYEI